MFVLAVSTNTGSSICKALWKRILVNWTLLNKKFFESLQDNSLFSENLNEEYKKSLTLGARLADKVATFSGSWSFII